MRLNRITGPPAGEKMRLVEELYGKYRALMYKFARGQGRSDSEADDIVSETLRRLFRHADTLVRLNEPQRIDYLARTVKSAAWDLDRKRRAEERRFVVMSEDARLAPDPEEGFIERESEAALIRHLYETLDELSETDRLLLIGRYLEELSDEALARQLGVKAASVSMKLSRARRRARRILERKEADDDGQTKNLK